MIIITTITATATTTTTTTTDNNNNVMEFSNIIAMLHCLTFTIIFPFSDRSAVVLFLLVLDTIQQAIF